MLRLQAAAGDDDLSWPTWSSISHTTVRAVNGATTPLKTQTQTQNHQTILTLLAGATDTGLAHPALRP